MGASGFDPARHVPLDQTPWDAQEARRAIGEVIDDVAAHRRPGGLWPAHPQDDSCWDDAGCIYFGGAGVVLALHHLERRGFSVPMDLGGLLPALWAAHPGDRTRFDEYGALPSLLMGDVGLRLLELRLAPTGATAAGLHERVEESLRLPVRELMWGLAGTMLASADAHAITGERRWRDLFEAAAARLLGDLQDSAAGPIWVQDLYGGRKAWLGPVHGYAGNLAPLLRGWAWLTEAQREQVAESMRTVLPATAYRSEAGVTWPGVTPAGPPRLVQHCHGAPGMVTTLAAGPVRSAELDRLFLDAGRLTWRAGPLAKGSNLCHGTAGNGYAFLRLWRQTSDPVWLERARIFAMTAIRQCREARRHLGRGRFTLWTGDPGLALYLADCLDGDACFPCVAPVPPSAA